MKLHLPKALLTAVLAACMVNTTAWGGWGDNGEITGVGDVYYVEQSNIAKLDIATDKPDLTTLYIAQAVGGNGASGNKSASIEELILKAGDTLSVVTHPWRKDGSCNFSLLTINKLTIGDGTKAATFNVNAKQTVQINDIDGTFSKVEILENGKLIAAGTDVLTSMASATGKVKVDGTLELTAGDALQKGNVILNATGTGVITSNANVTIGSTNNAQANVSSAFAGTITMTGGTLSLGDSRSGVYYKHSADLSNATIKLANAANLYAFGDNLLVKKIQVAGSGGTEIKLHEARTAGERGLSVSELQLDTNVRINANWGADFAIGKLTGKGELRAWFNNTQDNNRGIALRIDSVDNFSGDIVLGKNASGALTHNAYITTYIGAAGTTSSISGTISNYGTLNIGTAAAEGVTASTISLLSTIENGGTLSLSGNIILGMDMSKYTLAQLAERGSYSYDDYNGFYTASGNSYYLVEGNINNITLSPTLQAKLGENIVSLEEKSDGVVFVNTNAVTSTEFFITNEELTRSALIQGTESTHVTDSTAFLVKGTGVLVLSANESMSAGLITVEGTGKVKLTEKATLVLDNESNASTLLAATIGEAGTIDLQTTALISNESAPQFGGSLKVSSGGVLQLATAGYENSDGPDKDGDTANITVDLSKLENIELAGGTVRFRGGDVSLGNIIVSGTTKSILNVFDQFGSGSTDKVVSINTLTMGGDLEMTTKWKSNIAIDTLTDYSETSTGNLSISGSNESRSVSISNIKNYSGTITVTGGEKVSSNLTFKSEDGSSDLISFTGLKSTDESNNESNNNNYIKISYSDANTVKIERQRSADNQGTQISKLALTDGSTIIFYGTSNKIVTTIDELIVAGSATVKAEHHEGDVKITGLSGTGATLNLVTKTPTSRTSRFTLSDSDSHTHAFSGTINVYTTTDSGSRRTVFNLNSATAAQNAVVTLADCSTGADGADTVALAIGADKVTIAGLADGTGHKTDGSLMVVSGEQGIGEAAFKSDTKVRTLEINTAENTNWESSALIKENVNLVKSGKGSQTFTGSVASTSVSVLGGGLSLKGTETLQLQDLVVKSGATLSVGSNGSGVVSFVNSTTATASTTSSTQGAKLEGGATINGGLDLSGATSLTLDGVGSNFVEINGDLKLTKGSLTLSGDVLNSIASLHAGEQLEIFDVKGGFFVGGTRYSEALTASNGIILDTIFSSEDINLENYYLGFNYVPDEAGYSTVYIGMIVPEPTTATLSLLALAALAARRRRK